MRKPPKKPRIKRFLMTLAAVAGLGGGAFFMTSGDMTDTFNKVAQPDSGSVIISTELSKSNDNIIYYNGSTVSIDQQKVYSTAIVPLEPGSGNYPVIIIPVDPGMGGGGTAR